MLSPYVDYLKIFLIALLQVFRAGAFQDGSLITDRTWSPEALGDVKRLAVFVTCAWCSEIIDVPVFSLHCMRDASQ